MSGVLEYVVCVVRIWVVATCLFDLCVVFILLQEGHRELRCFVDRNINSLYAASAQPLDTAPSASTLGQQASDPKHLEPCHLTVLRSRTF
jgi:hypothetical protein